MTVRASYTSIVSYTSVYGAVSTFRARKIITALGNCLKKAVSEGKDISLPNLFDLSYTVSKLPNTFIIDNEVYSIENQIEDVAKETNILSNIVEKVILTYYKRINDLVEEGYKVTVKGIASIEPKLKEDGNYYVDVIISPVLSGIKVPEKEYTILTKAGKLSSQVLTKGNLRFSLALNENLKTPSEVISNKIQLEQIDI